MAYKIPTMQFYNGFRIPVLGLGTWKSKPGQVVRAVKDAIDMGYRHIDCALLYENEHEIGKAIAYKIAKKVVRRDELFVTGKLWNTFHRPDLVEGAVKQSLCDLRIDYLDLYLMHWPMAYQEGPDLIPMKKGKVLYSDVDYVDTWKAMEELVEKCYVKSIGVANFNKRQIHRLLQCASIAPVANQVECHPYLNQRKLMNYCNSKGIAVICYSPLGSPDRPWAKKGEPALLEDKKLKSLARKYKKTAAQIVLRYQIQRENIVIPKSVTKARIQQNMNIFDFKLSPADISIIDSFNTEQRFVHLRGDSGHPHHPFVNDEY